MVGDRRPHVSWIKNSSYSASDIHLPDYLIDTPQTREHWGRYLTDIEGLDRSIGEVDSIAAAYFGNKNYIFMYTADHGAQWPFGKWNLYDKGIKTSLLVRWPNVIKPKTRTDAMVSWIDIFPTLIDIAGGNTSKDIDGFSFKNVLTGEKNIHREYIYTTHTGDGDMNIYPIRSVRSGRYKYIRNLLPNCYHSNHSDILRKDGAGAYWDSWDNVAQYYKKAASIIEKYLNCMFINEYIMKRNIMSYNKKTEYG